MTSTPAPPPARPTRAELLEQLAEARAAGDRARVSALLGKLMLTPHDRPLSSTDLPPRAKPPRAADSRVESDT